MSINIRYIASANECERIDFMENWLSKSGIAFNRRPGVVVSDYESLKCYDRKKRIARFGYDLSTSEIGCFLAHRNCWDEAQKQKSPTLILESDMGFESSHDLGVILDQLMVNIECSDIVRLHGIFEHNEFVRRELLKLDDGYHRLVQCLGDPMGGGAYIVTPSAASILVKKSNTFYQPVDVFLGSTWLHRLRFRTLKPYPFSAADFGSEIGERTRPRQSTFERLSIEAHRFIDDVRRILYMPFDLFR